MTGNFAEQMLQILGALVILLGYVLGQLGVLKDRSVKYLLLNLTGAALLAVLAVVEQQWGFVLLEGVWAVVSAVSLIRVLTNVEMGEGISIGH